MKNIFKKFSAFAIVTMLLLCAIPMNASAARTSGECGEGVVWSLDTDTGTLEISGTGAMDSEYEEWSNNSDIKTVILNEGVTTVSSGAFKGCIQLTSVTLPNSLKSIEGSAFRGCKKLSSITIPASVTEIDSWAFYECHSLTSITVDANNNNYSSDSNGVLFNKNMTELIRYPSANTNTHYTVSSSVKVIKNMAFTDCLNLTNVIISDGVESIQLSAFDGCQNLETITIPASTTEIRSNAFDLCGSLKDVYYSGTKDQWEELVDDCLPLKYSNVHFNHTTTQTPNNNTDENISNPESNSEAVNNNKTKNADKSETKSNTALPAIIAIPVIVLVAAAAIIFVKKKKK